MSQLLLGEFAIAASKTETCSSQDVMLHLTNCALLQSRSGIGRDLGEGEKLEGIEYVRCKFLRDLFSAFDVDIGDCYEGAEN